MATNEQLYDRALILIEGDKNIKANPKKGWKQMMELADSGYDKACIKYANHLFHERGNWSAALVYYEKVKLTETEDINDYAVAVYLSASKKLKNLGYLNDCVKTLARYEDDLVGDGMYCFAVLLKLTNPADTERIKQYLYYAALGGSEMMSDSEYAEIGRERGVLSTKAEMDAWLEVASDAEYVKFIPCEKSEDDAWFYASENLESEEVKKILTGAQIKHLLQSHPKGVLEYQPLIRMAYDSGVCKFGYKYNNPNYTTVSTGSGTYDVATHWTSCCSTFKTKQKQNELWQVYNKAKTTDNFVEARVRTTPYGYSDVIKLCSNMAYNSTKSGTKDKCRDYVAKEANFDKKYVEITLNSYDIHPYSLELIYVPFYFFTYNISKTKSVTVRVNAFTCEVDYFENNPFGQFTEEDDVGKGGGASKTAKTKSKEQRAKSKERAKRRKSRRAKRSVLIVELALAVLGLLLKNFTMFGICLALILITLFVIIKFRR